MNHISITALLAKAAYLMMSRVVFYTAAGVVINLIFLFFLWPKAAAHWNFSQEQWNIWDFVVANLLGLAATVCLLASIILYFMLGKSRAVGLIVHEAMGAGKSSLMLYFSNQFLSYTEQQDVDPAQRARSFKEKYQKYNKRLQNLPRPIRWMFFYLNHKYEFTANSLQAFESMASKDSLDAGEMAKTLDEHIQVPIEKPGIWMPLLLVTGNGLVFFLFYLGLS